MAQILYLVLTNWAQSHRHIIEDLLFGIIALVHAPPDFIEICEALAP